MPWILVFLAVLIWYLHGRNSWPTGGTADAGGLTPAQKSALIAHVNAAVDALIAGNIGGGFLAIHWTEIRLYQPGNGYIVVLADGTSDYVHYTAATLKTEVCTFTTRAADALADNTLIYCP
jgi:hypothetical protein